MEMREWLEDLVPCMVMVVMEACTIGVTIMANTALSRGMSPFVFVVYTNALASIILLPTSLISRRDRAGRSSFTFPFLVRVFFLGLLGVTIAQNLAFLGLSYSSPIMVCGMGNLIPAFSFLLSTNLSTTKLDWRSSSSQARLIGTLTSMVGATSLTLYRGPAVEEYSSFVPSLSYYYNGYDDGRPKSRFLVFVSSNEHWILGAVLLASSALALSLWNFIQVGTVKICPQVMRIVSFYSLIGTFQSAILCLIIERDSSAWRLDSSLELIAIVLTAVYSSVIRSHVQMWCANMKGPLYVPMFKPVGILAASICGCVFFADTFHYGSMMGASIIGLGYYVLMWGLVNEDGTQMMMMMMKQGKEENLVKETVPLLLVQEEIQEV